MKILASFIISESIYPIVEVLLPHVEAAGMMFRARYTDDPAGKTGPTHRVSEGHVEEEFVEAFASAAALSALAEAKELPLPAPYAEAIAASTVVVRDYVGATLYEMKLVPYIGDMDEEDPTSS